MYFARYTSLPLCYPPDSLENKNVKTCMKGINWVTIIMGDSLLVSTMFLFFPLL